MFEIGCSWNWSMFTTPGVVLNAVIGVSGKAIFS